MKIIGLCIVLAFLASCQNLGHNASFLLQFKKEVREFYAVEDMTCNDMYQRFRGRSDLPKIKNWSKLFPKCTYAEYDDFQKQYGELVTSLYREGPDELVSDRAKHLAKIYTTNLPFSATDHYDIRTIKSPIRAGDPLNVIINKVHLNWNGEFLSLIGPGKLDTGEIAVVVTVDDGKAEEPRQVLVAYETRICNNVDLPIEDLLAYSTDSYGDEPIRIEVTVIDLDQQENETNTQILTTAAELGKFFQPAFAPGFSLAAQVGKLLINTHKDDIIAKMTFELYPWQGGDPGRVSGHIGVPKVAVGKYLIVNLPNAEVLDENNTILEFRNKVHVNYDLNAYLVPFTVEQFKELEVRAVNGPNDGQQIQEIRPWPIPISQELNRSPLNMSYVVVTVDSGPLSSAGRIISRMDTINRSAAGLIKNSQLTTETALGMGNALDDVKSFIKRLALETNFRKLKTNPEELQKLITASKSKDNELNDKDKGVLANLVRGLLPCLTEQFMEKRNVSQGQEIDTLEAWYKSIKGNLIYDPILGQYVMKVKDSGKCYLTPPLSKASTAPGQTLGAPQNEMQTGLITR